MTEISFAQARLAESQALLDRLIAEHQPGHALQREFQTDPDIYQLELERIWRRGWLFVGHTCQVKSPGDYFVFEIDTDSIIVIRGDDGQIHALHNTCRHRGMKVCQEASGHVGRIVCPYHSWARRVPTMCPARSGGIRRPSTSWVVSHGGMRNVRRR